MGFATRVYRVKLRDRGKTMSEAKLKEALCKSVGHAARQHDRIKELERVLGGVECARCAGDYHTEPLYGCCVDDHAEAFELLKGGG